MRVWNYKLGDLVEISDTQYSFIMCVVKAQGNMQTAIEEFKVSREQLDIWDKDAIFKSALDSHLTVLFRSRGLTADYIKSYLLTTLAGKEVPTKIQMSAINASVKALGMGLGKGPTLKTTMTADNTVIEFNDGTEE